MSWVMQTDGTIINTDNTVWADKTLTAPYPANIWRITEGTNDGKPYHMLLAKEFTDDVFTASYPANIWRIDSLTNDGKPYHMLLAKEFTDDVFTASYPANIWRIDSLTNDGRPYHLLLPDITSINLIPQPGKPLIHIYDSRTHNASDYDGNGYAVIHPISGKIRHEKNGLYNAEIEACIDSDGAIKHLESNAVLKIPFKYHDKWTQQLFRINNTVRKMDSSGAYRISVTAPHIFYDLNDKLLMDCTVGEIVSADTDTPTYKGVTGNVALNQLFESVYAGFADNDIVYSYSSDIVKKSYTETYTGVSLTGALLGSDNSFVNRLGGALYRDNFRFSINKDMEGHRETGVIRYGYNLTEIEFTVDTSELFTYLVAEDNYGNRVVVQNYDVPCKRHPHHIYRYVKMSYTVESRSRLQEDAQAYYDNFKDGNVNIKVKLANIANKPEYEDFLQLADFEVGDKVIVYHKDLDVHYGNLEIIAKTYDIVNQSAIEIEIGTFKNAIVRSGYMSGTVSSGGAEDKAMQAMQSQLNQNTVKNLMYWDNLESYSWDELEQYTWDMLEGDY